MKRPEPRKLPSGLYRMQTSVDGQRISITRRTKRECYQEYDRLKTLEASGLRSDGLRLTLADYLQDWLKARRRAVRDTTWSGDEIAIRLRIVPALGSMRILDLSASNVDAWLGAMQEAGVSAYNAEKAYEVLNKALADALQAGKIGRNPCDGVIKPKRPHTEKRALTPDERARLLQAAQGDRFGALIFLAAVYGIRESELLGLQWGDIDWDTGEIHVHKQLLRRRHSGMFGPVKTVAGNRRFMLGMAAMQILSAHYARQLDERAAMGERWQDHDLIFPTGIGTPENWRNMIDRHYLPILRHSGVPAVTFHELRHTAATLMLKAQLRISLVAKILGHDPAVLMRTYAHLIPDDYVEAAQTIEETVTLIPV